MTPPSNQPAADLDQRREQLWRSLLRVKTAAGIILAVVGTLAISALVTGWSAEKNEVTARKAEAMAESQRAQAEIELANSRLAEARALRLSGQVGRRFQALAAIRQAAAINPSNALRDEAVASLGLVDFGEDQNFIAEPADKTSEPLCISNYTIFVYGARDGSVQFLAANSGDKLFFLPGNGEPVIGLAISPDERYLAVTHPRQKFLWDLHSRSVLFSVTIPGLLEARNISFDHASSLIAFSITDSKVRIWRIATGKELPALEVATPGAIAFHPLKNVIAVQSRSEAQVWNLDTLSKIATEKTDAGHHLNSIAWSPDGKLLGFAADDAKIYLINMESRQRRILEGHTRECVQLVFNHAGEKILSYSWGGNSRLWDVPSGESEISTFNGYGIGFSPDDSHVFFLRHGLGFGLWPMATSTFHHALKLPTESPAAIREAQMNRDGTLLAMATQDGVGLWNVRTRQLLDFKKLDDSKSVRFTSDGQSLMTSGLAGLKFWELSNSVSTGEIKLGRVKSIPLPATSLPEQAVMGEDEKSVLVECGRSRAFVIDLQGAKPPVLLKGQPGLCNLAFHSGRGLAATGTWQGVGTRIWDALTGTQILDIGGRDATVAFSPDGHSLVVGTSIEYAIWDIDKRARAKSIPRETASEATGLMAFTPDGKILAIAKSLREVQLVDPATLRTLLSIPLLGDFNPGSLDLDPSGEVLMISSGAKLDLWNISGMRRELASLGLDWETPISSTHRGATHLAISPEIPTSTGFRYVIMLALAGVCITLFFAVVVLQRFQNLIESYGRIEELVLERNQQLEVARTTLFQGEKMRALGTLAAGIAHDFNNLLSVIRMANKLNGKEAAENPEVQENVQMIERAVGQGKQVVNSMLGYNHEPTDAAQPYLVADVVQSAVGMLGKQFLSGIKLRLDIDAPLPTISGSRSRLEQILLNLIVNASEAMSGQGILSIAVHHRRDTPTPAVLNPRNASEYVELSVSDTGQGIPPEVLSRIFEPFFSTKSARNQRGSGLGLSTVYNLAQAAGLGLSVESVVQKGACFKIWIPVDPISS